MSTVKFKVTDVSHPYESSYITIDTDNWETQADCFFRFLLSQGFILSEKDMSDFFLTRASEMSDLRSNYRDPVQNYSNSSVSECGI